VRLPAGFCRAVSASRAWIAAQAQRALANAFFGVALPALGMVASAMSVGRAAFTTVALIAVLTTAGAHAAEPARAALVRRRRAGLTGDLGFRG
jgi:hypothetical protein